jgi:DNA-binding CsgD family transcriptional regulator
VNRTTIAAVIRGVAASASGRVLVTGEAGIGKSTLVDAAFGQLGAAGFTVLRASPAFAERYTAYSMLLDLLDGLDWDSVTGLPDEHRTILEIALGRAQSSTEIPTLATAVAVEGILAALSARAPVVLLIDDLQWADQESLAAVERAVRRLPSRAVSLVATIREYGTGTDGNNRAFAFDSGDVYALDGLTVDELDLLIRPLWPSTLTRDQVVALREHTGGNPMWALELVGRGRLGELGALPVGVLEAPLPLAAAVADRLRALSPAAAEVVSVVSLLGQPDLTLLAEVLRFTEAPAEAVDEAEAAGFLVLTTRSARTRHPLHASASAASLTPARRRELHAFIGRAATDPVVRAQHLQQSEPPGPDETIAEALTAAAVAMRLRGARLRSAHFDAQAVERTDPLSPRFHDRLLNQAQQLFSAGDHAACLRTLDGVSAAQLDPLQYDSYIALSTSSLASHVRPQGGDAAAFLAAQCELAADPARTAILGANEAMLRTLTVSERAGRAAAALRDLDGIDAPNAVHRAIRGAIRARVEAGGGLDQKSIADMTRRQSIQLVVGLDDTGLATTASLVHLIDDVRVARDAYAELARWARREGKEGAERTFLGHGAHVEVVADDVAAAWVLWERTGLAVDSPDLPPELQHAAGLLLVTAGRHDGLAGVAEAWRASAQPGSPRDMELSALLGLSAIARANWPEAVGFLLEAARIADGLELAEPGTRARADLPLVEALFHIGENDEAERRLADVRAFLSDRDRPITGIALERLTSIQKATAGDMDGALGHATAAVDAAAAQQRPTDESLALLQRARVLHRKRQVTLARADLEAARDRARDSGIGAIGVVAERALAGTRQKRSPTELTASEEAVIALVREGGTNREIAAQLFVSVRTVESHVAAILRKSGASSRSRLISRGGALRPPS